MEVGPLNNIGLPVKGPTEGQPGRASDKTTKRNRLVGEEAKPAAEAADKADIGTRGVNLEELQGKIALASTAQKAVLRLIETINEPMQGAEDAKDASKGMEKTISQEFNGKPVFSGEKLIHKGADGTQAVAKLPDKAQLSRLAAAGLKAKTSAKARDNQALNQLNDIHKELTDFVGNAKNDLKRMLGMSNEKASLTAVKDIDTAEKLIAQAAKNRPETVPYNKWYGDMTAKVVKLLR